MIFLMIFLIVFMSVNVYADTVQPDVGYYIEAHSDYGNLYINIPVNEVDNIGKSGISFVNQGNHVIYCYASSSDGNDYVIKLSPFHKPQIRLDDSYSYSELNITGLIDSNVPYISDVDISLLNQYPIVSGIGLLLLGVLFVICMIKL